MDFRKQVPKFIFFKMGKKIKKDFFGNKSNVRTTEQSFYAYLYSDLNVFMDCAGLQC